MAECDALLTGQFANQYFERTVTESRRLDVTVQRDRSQLMKDYLSKEAGYECTNTSAAIQSSSLVIKVRFRCNPGPGNHG